jgi:hypothetical protein
MKITDIKATTVTVPLDTQRAIRIIRANAAKWNIAFTSKTCATGVQSTSFSLLLAKKQPEGCTLNACCPARNWVL